MAGLEVTKESYPPTTPLLSGSEEALDRDGWAQTEEDDDWEGDEADAFIMNEMQSRNSARVHTGEEEGKRGYTKGDDDDDFSPLAQVAKVVPATDDPTIPSLTFRAILLGSIFAIMGAAMSQVFFFKSNSPQFSSYAVILVTLPLGRWLANALPTRQWRIFGFSFTLNPGPFSIKEHILIGIIQGAGTGSAYAADVLAVQELFLGTHLPAMAGITLLLTTQLIGFGLAGLVADILVAPPAFYYPSNLVVVQLYQTLHASATSPLFSQRMRVFWLVFGAISIYQVS